jgi:hypothetical protein
MTESKTSSISINILRKNNLIIASRVDKGFFVLNSKKLLQNLLANILGTSELNFL